MAGRLPSNWHWVNGRDKSQGARDPEGNIHSRSETERIGAEQSGFRSVRDERTARARYAQWESQLQRRGRSSPQWAIDNRKARETAERRGEKFTRRDQARLDAARVGMQMGRTPADRERAKVVFMRDTGRNYRPDLGGSV